MVQDSPETNVLILACSCSSYLGRLSYAAASDLKKQEKIACINMDEQDDIELVRRAIARADRCITVDGCEQRCIRHKLAEAGLETEFYLFLPDLGIVEVQDVNIRDDDLTLVKDGIVAESTRVSGAFPMFPCGCCS